MLVTAEGRELYTKQVIKASKPTLTVEVPIRPEYAPNFYVSAAFVLDGKLPACWSLHQPALRWMSK